MRMTTIKTSEANASALVQRLYPNLTESQRKQAETALLKANPHLAEASAFRPGAVVTLPDTPELKPKPRAASDDPLDDMLSQLSDAMANFRDDRARRIDAALDALAGEEAILKDKDVAASIKNSPEASELAKGLAVSLRESKKTLAEDKKANEALAARIDKDLDALFK